MKLFDDDTMQNGTAGNFGFSGVRPDKLGAAEYTLVTMVSDRSGSIRDLTQHLLDAKRAIVGACQKSPRADFLMLRDVEFSSRVEEVHGFKELATIDASQYQEPVASGQTVLYDATFAAVAATNEYAKTLADADFSANAIVFVQTDGADYGSTLTPKAVAAEIARGVANEWLESLIVVLIGINASQYAAELEKFRKEGELTQYIDVGDATPQRLAKLADWVSRSVSAQSQAKGTGGPSQPLTF